MGTFMVIGLTLQLLSGLTGSTSTYRAIGVTPQITQIPADIPSNVTHVTITANKQLTSLAAGGFENQTLLWHADFSSNNLDFLHPDTFRGTLLRTLILYDNSLTKVPFLDFVSGTLTVLSLKWNKISQLPLGALDTYPSLQQLDLSSNPLVWSSATLDGLTSVTGSLSVLALDTTSGPVSTAAVDLSSYAFQNLTELRLSRLLTPTASNVVYLNSSVSNLGLWDLSVNSLSNQHISNYTAAVTAQQLVLSYNSLTSLPEFGFSGWKGQLTSLDLKHNSINSVDINTLNGMSNLVTLDLTTNQITHFPNFSTISLLQLHELSMGDNLITYMSSTSLQGLTSLAFLFLNNNPVTILEDMTSLVSSLSTSLFIDLTGTSLVCNCSYEFILQASQTGYSNLTLGLDTYPCASPRELVSVDKNLLLQSQICSNTTCQPIPTWIDIRTNRSTHSLGDTIEYYCRVGYLFTITSSDDQYKTSRCNYVTGFWEPSFDSCSEIEDPEEDARFRAATESPYAEVIGIFIILFLCGEMAFLLVLDFSHFQQCHKKCQGRNKLNNKQRRNKVEHSSV